MARVAGKRPGSRVSPACVRGVNDLPRRLIWHLSPARLISGMSYLGQWQERVLAILRHAYRYDHVLDFDDLLGLFEAGKTRDSAMCVADTLRTQLDLMPIRNLAEMTDEAWSILRERDRDSDQQCRFAEHPTASLGFAGHDARSIECAIEQEFRPEFLKRIDEVVVFQPLTVEVTERIVEKELETLSKHESLKSRRVRLRWNREVVRRLAATGFDPRLGARPLWRALEREVVVRVARRLLVEKNADALTEIDLAGLLNIVEEKTGPNDPRGEIR